MRDVNIASTASAVAIPDVPWVAVGLASVRMSAPTKQYRCTVCEHVYDPAEGDPDNGIPPGTAFENLPEDWACPECGARKLDFEPIAD